MRQYQKENISVANTQERRTNIVICELCIHCTYYTCIGLCAFIRVLYIDHNIVFEIFVLEANLVSKPLYYCIFNLYDN